MLRHLLKEDTVERSQDRILVLELRRLPADSRKGDEAPGPVPAGAELCQQPRNLGVAPLPGKLHLEGAWWDALSSGPS